MNITFGVGNDGVVIQSLGQVRFSATPWTVAHQAPLSFTTSWSLLKLTFIESEILSNHVILCHNLLLLPSIFPSIRLFSNESALHIRWPKYWSFSISTSNEYSGLISFRIDWFDLLAVQGALKSLLQHHNLKASILWLSAFFMFQLICIIKAMVFSVVMYRCESWTIKKAEHWRIHVFKLWDWRRLSRVLWTAKRLN